MTERGDDGGEALARMQPTRLSRRGFLRAAGLAGGAAALAACAPGGSTAPSTASGSGTAAGSGGNASAAPSPAASQVSVGDALTMFNWADYVSPENIQAFKSAYGVQTFDYETYASNEELLATLQAGPAGRYDVGAPSAEFVPALIKGNFIQKIDWSKVPNASAIDRQFKGLWWDPTNAYQLPKDWGTTGISLRRKHVTDDVGTWAKFFKVAPNYSGKIVVVDSMSDVFTAALKSLGYSLNSVDPKQLGAARKILTAFAPHVLALNSTTYGDLLASEQAVLGLTPATGIAELRAAPGTADIEYIVPADGTAFWLVSWVIFRGAPHPDAAHAFLDFIEQPDIQAKESESNRDATPNDEARKLVDPTLLADPTVFPPSAVFDSGKLEAAKDTSTNPLRQEIWDEFRSKIGKS